MLLLESGYDEATFIEMSEWLEDTYSISVESASLFLREGFQGLDALLALEVSRFTTLSSRTGLTMVQESKLKKELSNGACLDDWRSSYLDDNIQEYLVDHAAICVDGVYDSTLLVQKTDPAFTKWSLRRVILTEGMFIYTTAPEGEGEAGQLRGRYRITPSATVTPFWEGTSKISGEKVYGFDFVPNPDASHSRSNKTFRIYCRSETHCKKLELAIELNRRYAELKGVSTETEYVTAPGVEGFVAGRMASIRGENRPSRPRQRSETCSVM